MKRSYTRMRMKAFLVMAMAITDLSAQQSPTTGYAPVNGLKMYYEVHGRGEPVVLLHGAFMTITSNWEEWIGELSRTRKVIAVEMQGHGRTADIPRELNNENLAALQTKHLRDVLKPNAISITKHKKHGCGGRLKLIGTQVVLPFRIGGDHALDKL